MALGMGIVNKTAKDGLLPKIIIQILKIYSSQKTNGQDCRREVWEEWKRDIDFLTKTFLRIKF